MEHATKVAELSDDLLMAEHIRDALNGQKIHRLRNVEVQVQDRNATVTGSVGTFYEKQLATSCCQRATGVLRVINDLIVDDY